MRWLFFIPQNSYLYYIDEYQYYKSSKSHEGN